MFLADQLFFLVGGWVCSLIGCLGVCWLVFGLEVIELVGTVKVIGLGWLVWRRLIGRLVGWPVFVDRSIHPSVGRSVGRSVGLLIGQLAGLSVGR